jgi:hypothetical protein
VLGAAGVLALACAARPAGAAICGDLNGDGLITIADAVRLQKAVIVQSPADCGGMGSAQCGNVNVPDGVVCGIPDVVTLINFLGHKSTNYPLCQGVGPDPCSANPSVGSGPGGEAWTSRITRTGNLTTSEVWKAGCRIDIDGLTFVQPGVVITIQPGALIVGKNPPTQNGGPTAVSALVFLRDSKIVANGTALNPILMTSSSHVDANNGQVVPTGDWGGLTINGRAPVNCSGGECLAEGLQGVPFGGTNPNDNSGAVEYVRVEFSGRELSPDNELNVITLNGVGRGTVYDHVQANNGFDDCHEWFGGNVDGKFLVSSGCGDDLFDTQLGTTSRVQHYLGIYYEPYMQNAGNHGFEWDDNENGFDLLPRNAPLTCNITLIGSNYQPSVGLGQTERATNLRRGTAGVIANTIWEHFRSAGILVTDNATAAQACDNATTLHAGGLLVEHSLLFDNGFDATGGPHLGQVTGNWTTPCTAAQWYAMLPSIDPTDPTQVGHDPHIPVIYGTAAGTAQTDLNQFIPAGSSPGVATEPLVNSLAMNCKNIDPFFDTTDYVGAFRPGDPASNWLTTPWISFRLH